MKINHNQRSKLYYRIINNVRILMRINALLSRRLLQIYFIYYFFKKEAGQSGPQSRTARVKLCQLELGTAERLLSNPTTPGLYSAPCSFHVIMLLTVAKLKRFEFKCISLAGCAFYFQLHERKKEKQFLKQLLCLLR